MDKTMTEHLTTERISALLDEPWLDKVGQEHLESCGDCQAEFERLSRMRMALSALSDEDAPLGQWTVIEAALDKATSAADTTIVPLHLRLGRRLLVPGPLQAAAALVLFAGGVFAGLQITRAGSSNEAGNRSDLPGVVASSNENRAMLDGLTQLESLRSPLQQVGMGGEIEGARGGPDPFAATQRLARLEGFIRALRDQLDESPGDPLASAYLVELVEERDRLEEELQASVRRDGVLTW